MGLPETPFTQPCSNSNPALWRYHALHDCCRALCGKSLFLRFGKFLL
uniref:Uncharacterized protein n=1 Tax=Anguilla anguilla TaxID=7936 RepID=A0A0E9SMU1_ANGAN